jgi:carbamoyl-phosphate synthase large subunit
MTAAHRRGGRVFAGDVDSLAPALYVADGAVQIRRAEDPAYVAGLLEIVSRHEIALIVPTIDTDLRVLAAAQAEFGALGCRVAVSTTPFVTIAADKYDTGAAFAKEGIAVPRMWLPPIERPDELPAVVFVKPRRGSASQDIHRIGREGLDAVLPLVPGPVVQEDLVGPEITIDALLDLRGRPVHFVPRLRIRTLAGESIQGRTLDHDAALETWIERILDVSSAMGACGPLTLQAFQTDRGPVLSEINPRFGGGFPLALAAGASYPEWLLDMVGGGEVQPRLRDYEPGLYMTRYHVEHLTRSPKW